MKWRRSEQFSDVREGDQFLVAAKPHPNDGDRAYAIAFVKVGRFGSLSLVGGDGLNDGWDRIWSDVVWCIPLDELTPPDRIP